MDRKTLLTTPLEVVFSTYDFMEGFITDHQLNKWYQPNLSFSELVASMTEEEQEEWALDPDLLMDAFYEYLTSMRDMLGLSDTLIDQLTLLAGRDKSGQKEGFEACQLHPGDIVAIVGPTGSGKSRLLADIEWTADRDTPTQRKIMINGKDPDKKWRFSSGNKLVAQLSQNMNFVMDLSVKDFIELHAESRLVDQVDDMVKKIIDKANELAGESFGLDTQITSLSGGQSRALMIADTAILSQSPIVLIDEIENAGIDRKKALDLLVGEEKIVLIATHDPILALMADRRIVIANGGITKVIETQEEEKDLLNQLEEVDALLSQKRQELRYGKKLTKVL